MFWGLSPALDLQEEYSTYKELPSEEFNVLLIGGRDARHVIMTIAKMYKHPKRSLNFLLVDFCPELVVRQLLLLSIAFENSRNIGLATKTRMFMEIYGNTLLRSSTSKYLITKAKQLTDAVTDLQWMNKMIPCVDFENIKYRERDYIEIQLKFWQKSTCDEFDVCKYWDRRVRALLGPRYDVRNGVFDWDYYMRLKDIGGQTIASQEYNHFRQTGVAFAWLETEVSRPNCSLAAGITPRGDELVNLGYIGDIQTGPYISYGLDCEDTSMMKKVQGVHEKRATDITERNLLRLFYEIEHKSEFTVNNFEGNEVFNLGLTRIKRMDAEMVRGDTEENDLYKLDDELPSLDIEPAKVTFYSYSNLDYFFSNQKYKSLFDIVYVSNDMMSKLDSNLLEVARKDALILCENNQFVLKLSKEKITSLGVELVRKATDLGLTQLKDFDAMKDPWAKFSKSC